MTSYKNFILDFGFRIQKNTPSTKFEQDLANILAKMQVSSHSEQKVAMATLEINKNCHYMQNAPHRCEVKLEKFRFDIMCRFGVIKESLSGGWNTPPPPQGEIGLR